MSSRVARWAPHAAPLGRALTAIGVFDGVHLGHQALVRDLVARSRSRGLPACVLTFDRDPDEVVHPHGPAPQLTALEDKIAALDALDPDAILVVPFDEHLAALEPPRFVDEVVLQALTPTEIIVGTDFRFGAGATGDVAMLASLGAARGFTVVPHELIAVDGAPVTSTRVRALLASGDIDRAAVLLGKPHRVRGVVVHGRGEGLPLLGTPTANLRPDVYAALPREGVYAGIARVGTEYFPGAVSVGLPPSFPEALDRLEVHLIGYDGPPLYDVEIAVDFISRLRDQKRFESPGALAAHIREDVSVAEQIAARYLGQGV